MSASDSIGPFRGGVHPEFDTPGFRAWLARFDGAEDAVCLSPEIPHIRVLRPPGALPELLCKRFSPLSRLCGGRIGRAQRAFDHGLALRRDGVPTPQPAAWLERYPEGKPAEEFLFTVYLPGSCSLRGALLHHYYENPRCAELMQLLQVAADALRKLHGAGWRHGNLVNRNLLVRRGENGEWAEGWILDLHRARRREELSAAVRGRDNARIDLPSDLRRVFLEMQYAPEVPPSDFLRAERRCRLRRSATPRRLCHRLRPRPEPGRPLPSEQDIWIWDDRSRQAIPALRGRDKKRYYRKRDGWEMACALARHGRAVHRAYRELRAEAWTRPLSPAAGFGLSCNLDPDRFEKERRWLEPLGPLPLLVRLYHHESPARLRFAMEAVRRLRAEGHPVVAALVQDRRAVTDPASWRRFVDTAGGALSGFVEAFEVGHAVNRVKWGVWNYAEYRGLLAPFVDWDRRYPQIPLWGPAGIDFEYPRVFPLLEAWTPVQRLAVFSHHLYVDRRGAPENRQSGFDLVDKLALARAMARAHPACADRLVVSEVNWPLAGTGVWSPVGSPYQSPGLRSGDPSVDEATCADYLRRYYLLALCSGMAERVYWWNLAAHGFGLIDDRDPAGWRPRPAYFALVELLKQLRGAVFTGRKGGEGEIRLAFSRAEESFEIAWTPTETPQMKS